MTSSSASRARGLVSAERARRASCDASSGTDDAFADRARAPCRHGDPRVRPPRRPGCRPAGRPAATTPGTGVRLRGLAQVRRRRWRAREAALITYYGFLSIFPVLLLAVAIVSWVRSTTSLPFRSGSVPGRFPGAPRCTTPGCGHEPSTRRDREADARALALIAQEQERIPGERIQPRLFPGPGPATCPARSGPPASARPRR